VTGAEAEPRRVELSNVYVGLKTKTIEERAVETEPASRGRDAGSSGDAERAALSALDATARHRHLVMLGDPGSGKSTFVNYLALCLARHLLAPEEGWLAKLPGWPDPGAVPIVVTLRDFALLADAVRSHPDGAPMRPDADALWGFLEGELQRHRAGDASTALERALDAGEAVVFLDGLDEVTGPLRRVFVHDAVEAFMARYDRCRFLVTCRTLAYQDKGMRLRVVDAVRRRVASGASGGGAPAHLRSFELAPFDAEAIDRFIAAWYGELARLQTIPAGREAELAAALRSAVRRPDLASLAPNPLLLTVMALVHAHKGVLPDARAQLYEDTVDLLLWRWEQVKTGSGAVALRALLDRAGCRDVDLKQALWELAFTVHRDGGAGDAETLADIGEHRLLKGLAGLHPRQLDRPRRDGGPRAR
jgi:predicted NACHT family NTPase